MLAIRYIITTTTAMAICSLAYGAVITVTPVTPAAGVFTSVTVDNSVNAVVPAFVGRNASGGGAAVNRLITAGTSALPNAFTFDIYGGGHATKPGNIEMINHNAASLCMGTSDVCNLTIGSTGVVSTTSAIQIGGATLAISSGEIGMPKIATSSVAPGAGGCKEAWVCGTNPGTAKKIAFCGTSSTPTPLHDNVGGGVSGC